MAKITPNIIKNIFTALLAVTPHPKTELLYSSNFELLIAVILSAQATDKSVNKATAELFKVANTPKQFLALGTEELKSYIKSIGLYNNKAKNIIKTCEILATNYNSQVPDDRAKLEILPGVGRKTANVILNTAFKKPTIAVDTHVFRVANRIGLAHGTTPLAIEFSLEKTIPKQFKSVAAHLLTLHGRYTCKAKLPLCAKCVINKWCNYYHSNN
jgi:endonuclease III